jgi:hypothetical protein
MVANNQEPGVKQFISATLDPDRLKLISCLSQEPHSVIDLAEVMDEDPASILRHLDVLEGANLVVISEHGGNKYYRFNSKHIEMIARQELEKSPKDLSFTKLPEDERRLVSNYIQADGSLKMIPSQTKKIKIILEYVIKAFELDVYYSEREVNEVLKEFHPDTAILRRYLVDYGFLARERDGSRYWCKDDDHLPISRNA